MTGVQIEYFLGLYFAISALSLPYPHGPFGADWVRLIIGIVLIVFAVVGISPIH